jgi:signal transduction histidine kinase
VGLLTVATITGTSQHGGRPSATASSWISWVAIVALNCFAAGGVAWVTSLRDQQHELRVKAIEDLTEANAKLEASMRENAGLHEQLLAGAREAGVLDERQRMAREIHDTLAQGLVGIITQLETAARGGRDSQRHSGVALELARDSLAEARRSVQALAPAELDQVRLPDACPSAPDRGGFGLTATRQRVEGLSGSLAVESEPGSGTTIAASIPVIPAASVTAEVPPTRMPVPAQA